MLEYLTGTELSADARRQVETFIKALGKEVHLPKRPVAAKLADGILAQEIEIRREIAAALADLAGHLSHESFESGGERFVSELHRYARLFDSGRRWTPKECPYFSRIQRTSLDGPARELLSAYFDARLTQAGLDEAESRVNSAKDAVRAQLTLALVELMHVQLPESKARAEQFLAMNNRMLQIAAENQGGGGSAQSADVVRDGEPLWRRASERAYDARREHDQTLGILRKLFSKTVRFDKEQSSLLSELIPYAEADQFNFPVCGVAKALAAHVEQCGLDDEMRPRLEALCQALLRLPDNNTRRWASRLRELMVPASDDKLVLEPADAWAKEAHDELAQLPADLRRAWADLLEHARGATRNKPSKAWLKTAKPLVATLVARRGVEEYVSTVCRWFANLGNRKPTDNNSDILRGLIQTSLLFDPEKPAELKALETLAPALADLAEAGCRRSASGMLVSSKLSTASVETLAAFPHASAVGQLGRLKQRLKADWIRDKIAKAWDEAVERHGLDAEDVEETLVPTCGFTEVGRREATFDGYRAELAIENTQSVHVSWTSAEGKPQKTEPAHVKRNFSAELKALKKSGADAMKIVAAHRDRLDRLFIQPKSWRLDAWRQHYLNHPLVGTLARRLIWSFKGGKKPVAGMWQAGELADVCGKPIKAADDAEVAIWHPFDRPADEVRAWRARLADLGVTQPFKQAHREIYLLTDAERATETYSNRFAGHVLRQHQFNALREARGWTYSLMGHWDAGDCVPRIELTPWNLRAEFWVQETADGATSPAGVLLYIGSDQVRFYRDGALLPLAEVPPLVFSEIMRDVDLFVGVASIGNDPNWMPQTGEIQAEQVAGDAGGQFAGYWASFSFGELSEAAKMCASVLREIVPRLKMAERCSFEERFLVVRGNLRTYRIHLGSGNILMEPGSQYLCIVRSANSVVPKVMLPFEGDTMVSLILSKALLLSADDKITDPSIRGQIERSD